MTIPTTWIEAAARAIVSAHMRGAPDYGMIAETVLVATLRALAAARGLSIGD